MIYLKLPFLNNNKKRDRFELKSSFQFDLDNHTQLEPIYRGKQPKQSESRLRSLSDLIHQKVKRLSIKSQYNRESAELDINSLKSSLSQKIRMSASMASFLKLTLVGDGGVGKSCLILQYMYGDVSEAS